MLVNLDATLAFFNLLTHEHIPYIRKSEIKNFITISVQQHKRNMPSDQGM
jgi:hypothetical protein